MYRANEMTSIYSTKLLRNLTKHPASDAYRGWVSRKMPICQEWLDDRTKFFAWVDDQCIPFIKGSSRFSRKNKTQPWSPENTRITTEY